MSVLKVYFKQIIDAPGVYHLTKVQSFQLDKIKLIMPVMLMIYDVDIKAAGSDTSNNTTFSDACLK